MASHKNLLQEYCQKNRLELPTYESCMIDNGSYPPAFTSRVTVNIFGNVKTIQSETLSTKRAAEMNAAQKMYNEILYGVNDKGVQYQEDRPSYQHPPQDLQPLNTNSYTSSLYVKPGMISISTLTSEPKIASTLDSFVSSRTPPEISSKTCSASTNYISNPKFKNTEYDSINAGLHTISNTNLTNANTLTSGFTNANTPIRASNFNNNIVVFIDIENLNRTNEYAKLVYECSSNQNIVLIGFISEFHHLSRNEFPFNVIKIKSNRQNACDVGLVMYAGIYIKSNNVAHVIIASRDNFAGAAVECINSDLIQTHTSGSLVKAYNAYDIDNVIEILKKLK